MEKSRSFNLTTKEGIKEAAKFLKRYGWAVPFYNNYWYLKKIFDFFSNKDIIDEQRKLIMDVIKAGKKQGLAEVEIEVYQSVGVDFEGDIADVPIICKIGKQGKMKIKAKYI